MNYVERLLASLENLSNYSWFPYLLGLLGLLVAFSVYQTLKSLPKLVMYPIVVATCAIVFMNWVYYRNEPAMLTPVVDVLAPFLPGKSI